jgi:glycerate-2-kinase
MKFYALDIFKESLKSAQPSALLNNSISIIDKNKIKIGLDLIIDTSKIKFISFGKSGGSMAEAFLEIIGYENIDEGIIVLPEYSPKPNIDNVKVKIIYSTHPYVSDKSVIAGNRVLDFAERCEENETVFCLVSGGGSALLASPIDGIAMKEKINLINNFLKMGIGEREVNIIRKKLSKIKGGSLAEKIYPARIINLILSDERTHQLEAIASGPTVKNISNVTAEEIINRFQLWDQIPTQMHQVFKRNDSNKIKPYPSIESYVIGSRDNLMNKLENLANEAELTSVTILPEFYDNDILKVKNELGAYYDNYFQQSESGKYLIAAYGEVPIKVTSNHGKGGRNQHLAAMMIEELKKYNNFEFLAIASDGCDFINGVHGALITDKHFEKINSLTIDADKYTKNFNSFELHKKIGSLIKGPMTGTNVNDFYLFYFEK